MKIGYLGPAGSYSELAAEKFRNGAKIKAYPNFPSLFSGLVSGECEYIAVPIENSLNGGVLQNIDLLQSTPGVLAFEELVVAVDHRLATLKGADPKRIKRIYSHGQALAQCAEFLARNFPSAELVATPSTAAGLDLIKGPEEAGIVGSHFSDPRFELSEKNIADEPLNLTHFLLVGKGGYEEVDRSEKIFFSTACRHRPGELFNILKIIKERGLNMTKIESRPIKDRPGEYRFFIELEGNIRDENALYVLKKIESESHSFKILGCY